MMDRRATAMLAASTLGMLLGLAIDQSAGRIATLAALCSAGSRGALYWIKLHWIQLPAMHGGMILGSFLGWPVCKLLGLQPRPLRSALRESSLCTCCMLGGMELGAFAERLSATSSQSPALMLVYMAAGMVACLLVGHRLRCPRTAVESYPRLSASLTQR